MSYIEAFLQAVLQGLTEFLPVSSSGHLSLFQHFTGQSLSLIHILLVVFFWARWKERIQMFKTEGFCYAGSAH